MVPPVLFVDNDDDPVTLNSYSDDHHGFMRAEITPDLFTGRYYVVPRPQDPYSKGSSLLDYFEFEWGKHDYRVNSLPASQGPGNG
jgi:acid phosphatase type 7